MGLIILIVLFTVAMFIWFLATLTPPTAWPTAPNWLAWFSVLILGLIVILTSTGTIVWTNR